MGILLLPIIIYGVLLFGLRFPAQERVEAGVSYREMLSEFGWGSAYIVSFLLIMGISQILTVFNGRLAARHSARTYASCVRFGRILVPRCSSRCSSARSAGRCSSSCCW